ncbi:MAG: ComEC family competence protein [Bacteroides sp.]|nr:ComEC family competence protein [Bacteroides sp.]
MSAFLDISRQFIAGILIAGTGGITILCLLKSFHFRWIFGLFLYGFLFSAGIFFYQFHLHKVFYSWPAGEQFYRARLLNEGTEKERSVLFRVTVEHLFQPGSSAPVNRKALLYVAKDSLAFQLRPGDRIFFQGIMASPKNNGNPHEFDYARFLQNRGISATAYIPSGKWVKGDLVKESFFTFFSRNSRKKVVQLYRDHGIEGEELAVLSAITIGYKEELSEDIRESYSVAGGSHILALSGLHIGVIAAVSSFLLSFPVSFRYAGALKKIIVLLLLWGYALVAGMSPSIVRAVIMFSIVTLSYYPWYPHFALNTLGATAFGMLVYRPFYLFDVGFQLSFAAVAAILLLYPRLEKCIQSSSRIIRYLWSLIAVSLAAQIGTLPLILFYFSRFSSYFLLTNLLIVLPASCLLYLFILFLAAIPFPALQSLIATVMQYTTWLMNRMVRGVEELPHASIDNWVFTPWEVLFIYLTVFFGLLYSRGSRPAIFPALFTLLVLAGGNLYGHFREPFRPLLFSITIARWLLCTVSYPGIVLIW